MPDIDIDLFSGAGGMSVGLQAVGFSPAHFYELDAFACQTLTHNIASTTPTLRGAVTEGGVETVSWDQVRSPVRLIAGGAPCQPFSLAGMHRAQHDGRNLFPEVLRAMRALNPRAVLLENVRGLLRPSFQPYFEYILRQLECPSVAPRRNELWQTHNARIRQHQCSIGYEPEYIVRWRLVDAADYGVPQNRLRVFIVATRSDFPVFRFPKATHSRKALLRAQRTNDYWECREIPRPEHLPGNGIPIPEDDGHLPWVTVRDALRSLPDPAGAEANAAMNHWHIPGARIYHGHDGSIADWPSKTIKAGVHGVPGGENTLALPDGSVRYFTLRETARIQTFPDTHHFVGARMHVTRQIGNAVPCLLAEAIARSLFTVLEPHQ